MLQTHSQLARRYAKALFDLASEKNNISQLQRDMSNVVAVLQVSSEVEATLKSPILSPSECQQILATLAKECNVSELCKKFFTAIIRNRRVAMLREIAEAFLALAKASQGIVEAQVTSAVSLSEAQIQTLEKQLSDNFHKKVKINVTVDQKILGGLVITIGSKMWDDSIAGKINRLHALNKQAIAAF